MSDAAHPDNELMQEFVSESSELIEALDQDLVTLEQSPDDTDLLDRIFRALHTIKGSSSFLGLDNLTTFAHAAEDALNALRKGEARADADTMDALLQAADVVRRQIEAIAGGGQPEPGPTALIETLHAIAHRSEAAGSGSPSAPAASVPDEAPQAATSNEPAEAPLELPASKLDLLPFMVDDLKESLDRLTGQLDAYEVGSAGSIADAVDDLIRSADFFEARDLVEDLAALHDAIVAVSEREDRAEATLPEARRLLGVLHQRAEGIADHRLLTIDTTEIRAALERAANDQAGSDGAASAPAATGAATGEPTESASAEPAAEKTGGDDAAAKGERTIRVDVERLETLLNLVGELVLQKNRVVALGRRLDQLQVDADLTEELDQAGSDLDRVTADLQMGVMKTRMQPLSKLFNRYPRMVRDLARSTGKQIRLEITGGETEVDKSVLEGLADPLVHILRNSGDHGIESTERRAEAGKDPAGTIRIGAWHEGSHVVVEISDDGQGLDPAKIGPKAKEKGLVTDEQLKAMTDRDILNLIFKPGFSTASQVSNISGRGVGMDVVRSNIVKMNGLVDLRSEVGRGSTVSIRIPLTVAIMPAMMIKVGKAFYALPLANVVEILRPEAKQLNRVGGRPTMRVRDRVLPLVDLGELFGRSETDRHAAVAVVIALGEKRMVVLVDGLVGQQEIVIKPIDEYLGKNGLISGATVREDGGVSLILDVPAVFETLHRSPRAAA